MTQKKFRDIVWNHYQAHGRHDLPWRKTTDAYRILVSEVMLQQTQVERTIPYYTRFLKTFPSVRALAKAPLSQVLIVWQGLGYNRRAKMLHEAAKASVELYGGRIPTSALELQNLPGVGPYTAGAVAAFAGNEDGIFVETNIRTVITHHFFSNEVIVSDESVRDMLKKVYPKGRAREWYAALMDYGAHLKRSGIRINTKAKGYAKQSTFKGSSREVRGAIVRLLSTGPATHARILALFDVSREAHVQLQLEKLLLEGLVVRKTARYHLSN